MGAALGATELAEELGTSSTACTYPCQHSLALCSHLPHDLQRPGNSILVLASRIFLVLFLCLSSLFLFLSHCLCRNRCFFAVLIAFVVLSKLLPNFFFALALLASVSFLALHRSDFHRYWAMTIILSLQVIHQCNSKSSVISSILNSQIRPDWSWRS